MDKNHQEKHIYIYIVTGVFLVLVMIGIVYAKTVTERTTAYAPMSRNTTTKPQVLGATKPRKAVSISLSGPQATVGQPTTVNVVATTGGQAIVGFDVLLGIKPVDFDVQEITSAQQGFEVFPGKPDVGTIFITGALKNSLASASVLNNQTIVTLTLIPKKAGSALIKILPQVESKKTKLVLTDLSILTPEIAPLSITVK